MISLLVGRWRRCCLLAGNASEWVGRVIPGAGVGGRGEGSHGQPPELARRMANRFLLFYLRKIVDLSEFMLRTAGTRFPDRMTRGDQRYSIVCPQHL